ncbi:MAG: hypothetical protein BWY66_00596 [bacterium ADurb.Bin374]|nr:MAG: hypothetical protein BWY66_00596 [bacterium ADurb.Bin374]
MSASVQTIFRRIPQHDSISETIGCTFSPLLFDPSSRRRAAAASAHERLARLDTADIGPLDDKGESPDAWRAPGAGRRFSAVQAQGGQAGNPLAPARRRRPVPGNDGGKLLARPGHDGSIQRALLYRGHDRQSRFRLRAGSSERVDTVIPLSDRLRESDRAWRSLATISRNSHRLADDRNHRRHDVRTADADVSRTHRRPRSRAPGLGRTPCRGRASRARLRPRYSSQSQRPRHRSRDRSSGSRPRCDHRRAYRPPAYPARSLRQNIHHADPGLRFSHGCPDPVFRSGNPHDRLLQLRFGPPRSGLVAVRPGHRLRRRLLEPHGGRDRGSAGRRQPPRVSPKTRPGRAIPPRRAALQSRIRCFWLPDRRFPGRGSEGRSSSWKYCI